MRYVSKYQDLRFFKENGEVGHEFDNGVLIVGDPTTGSGAGNFIDPNLTATDGTAYQRLYPSSGTDLGKIGKDVIFWEAPSLTNAATLATTTYYDVIEGTITYDGATLKKGQRFKTTATTSFTGTGKVAIAVPAAHYRPDELDEREEKFTLAHLGQGDEATYDSINMESTEPAMTWYR